MQSDSKNKWLKIFLLHSYPERGDYYSDHISSAMYKSTLFHQTVCRVDHKPFVEIQSYHGKDMSCIILILHNASEGKCRGLVAKNENIITPKFRKKYSKTVGKPIVFYLNHRISILLPDKQKVEY